MGKVTTTWKPSEAAVSRISPRAYSLPLILNLTPVLSALVRRASHWRNFKWPPSSPSFLNRHSVASSEASNFHTSSGSIVTSVNSSVLYGGGGGQVSAGWQMVTGPPTASRVTDAVLGIRPTHRPFSSLVQWVDGMSPTEVPV